MSLKSKDRSKLATNSVLLSQRKYAKLKLRQSESGLTIPEAFVRGIRHIGYRSNIDAIAELVDNSIQAYSLRVEIIFGYDEAVSLKKPSIVAVVDDGHGMAPEMLRLALMWGGTHRENDRSGLGRYGYGLPSSAVSIGKRFTIISKLSDEQAYSVTFDLDALDIGKYRNATGDVTLPPVRRAKLPQFVRDHIKQAYPNGWISGTIILIDKLDRLDWTTALGMRTNLVRSFGVTYHKLANETAIFVDNHPVLPIDPLFLSPECELYGLDGDRARPLDQIEIKVRNPASPGQQGRVTLRYAWLPPSFGAIDKARDAVGLNANTRFPILKDYHGVIFCRNGRVIDVQARLPWTVFINNDRYIRIEVEFSASLDEMFGVTTSKQQVSVSPEIWDILREAGLHKAIEQLRRKVRAAKLKRIVANPPYQAFSGQKTTTPETTRTSKPPPTFQMLLMFGEGIALQPNRSHPIFNGSAPSGEIAHALHALVTRICDASNANGEQSRAEHIAVLKGWARDLGQQSPDGGR